MNMTNDHKQISSLESLLHRMMNRIRQSLELPVILSTTVDEVRNFLGTDRVMVYQFDGAGNGKVAGESVDKNRLPSLLGQHFPADDIPLTARELFLKVRQRSIVDVSLQKIGLSPLICPEAVEPCPENEIFFRSVDPCHVEYLTSMGVKSSLVVPILHRDKLWGLLVSHHSSPRQVTSRELEVVQLVADQLSIAIAQSTLWEQARLQAQQEATINKVAKLLHSMTEMQVHKALELTVSALQAAGGRVYIIPRSDEGENQLFICGEQPIFRKQQRNRVKSKGVDFTDIRFPYEQNSAWGEWLQMEKTVGRGNSTWVFTDLYQASLLSDILQGFLDVGIRSLLVIRLQYRQQILGYLSLFRREIDIETIWGRKIAQDDPRHLKPMESFEIWREIQKNQPQGWETTEIELAQALASHFAIAVHQYQLYQQVRALNLNLQQDIEERKQVEKKISAMNAELEQRVQERTAELRRANNRLVEEVKERERALRERRVAQTSLERLSRQSELILNSAGEGIYGLNAVGKITFVNPAAARMLGYEIGELINRFMHEVVKHSHADGVRYFFEENPIYKTLQDGAVQHITDDIFYRRDGKKIPVEYVSTPIREKSLIVGAVVIFKDITERQIIERMKDEFISVVSHELRTPLTSIRSALGLLARGCLKAELEKSQRMLEIAFDNTNRLVRLINDILDIERINSGKVTMQKQTCNATELMMQAIDEMGAMAEKAEIKLNLLPTQEESINLWVDRDRIIQTITNLLSNAIKFSPPGSQVYLSANLASNPIHNGARYPQVIFQVQDQGRGIPEDKLERIFDRFQQVDASNSRHQGGTGLGLAICRSIVEQHGGKIWVESQVSQGSIFYFTLPMT